MYPKHKINELVEVFAPKVISILKLDHWTIRFHVYGSKSKKFKALKMRYGEEYGFCLTEGRTADIFIFYDKQPNKREAVGTLVHELLHVKMRNLVSLGSKSKAYNRAKRMFDLEEKIVRDLETFILEILFN